MGVIKIRGNIGGDICDQKYFRRNILKLCMNYYIVNNLPT